ncbi:thioredoxin family protein [uncultured Thiocystis sp.]|jgi:thioredoxin 1|uniref:thioredoxin family protein n=1 Tax=uncultured Thiocystis sp. TaxID=1202134 RepID=UPI0025FE3B14|nr:thioredoxin family protein [uncultured Thiocystis sp.]
MKTPRLLSCPDQRAPKRHSARVSGIVVASLLLGAIGAVRAELPSASAEAIRQALGSGHPTVIDVGARTCIPCKKMAPILESLANTYRGQASVLFVDLHADEATAKTLRIQMIPTQIFFDAQGQEVKRHIGFMDEQAILAEFKTLGVDAQGAE